MRAQLLIVYFMLQTSFFVIANSAITNSFHDSDARKRDLRSLRGVNIGLNVAGALYLPILIYIGIITVLSTVSSFVTSATPGAWSTTVRFQTFAFRRLATRESLGVDVPRS
jgi:hypothetical protein